MESQTTLKQFTMLYIAMFLNIGFYFNDHILRVFLGIMFIIGAFEIIMRHILQLIEYIIKVINKLENHYIKARKEKEEIINPQPLNKIVEEE